MVEGIPNGNVPASGEGSPSLPKAGARGLRATGLGDLRGGAEGLGHRLVALGRGDVLLDEAAGAADVEPVEDEIEALLEQLADPLAHVVREVPHLLLEGAEGPLAGRV